MIIHLFGIRGSDTGSADLNTETGEITVIPGNRYDDVKHALGIIRQAAEIKDPKLRQASSRRAAIISMALPKY